MPFSHNDSGMDEHDEPDTTLKTSSAEDSALLLTFERLEDIESDESLSPSEVNSKFHYSGNWHTKINLVYVFFMTSFMVTMTLAEYLKKPFKNDEPLLWDFPLKAIFISSAIGLVLGLGDAVVTSRINLSREAEYRKIEDVKNTNEKTLSFKDYALLTAYGLAKMGNRMGRVLFFFILIGWSGLFAESVILLSGITALTLVRNGLNTYLERIDASQYRLDTNRKRTELDKWIVLNAVLEAPSAFGSNYYVLQGIYYLTFLLVCLLSRTPIKQAAFYSKIPAGIVGGLNALGPSIVHLYFNAVFAAAEKNREYDNRDTESNRKAKIGWIDLMITMALSFDYNDHASDFLLLIAYVCQKQGIDLFLKHATPSITEAIAHLGFISVCTSSAFFLSYPQFRSCLKEMTATGNMIKEIYVPPHEWMKIKQSPENDSDSSHQSKMSVP